MYNAQFTLRTLLLLTLITSLQYRVGMLEMIGGKENLYGSVGHTRYSLKGEHVRVCRSYKVQVEG